MYECNALNQDCTKQKELMYVVNRLSGLCGDYHRAKSRLYSFHERVTGMTAPCSPAPETVKKDPDAIIPAMNHHLGDLDETLAEIKEAISQIEDLA